MKFDASDNCSRKYKIKAIRDSTVYTRELKDHLQRLYYLVSCKKYLEEENTWKPVLVV